MSSSLIHSSLGSWQNTPFIWKTALVGGLVGFAFASLLHPASVPANILATARTGFLAFAVAGIVANILASDEFFQKTYLEASAFAVAISAVILFAAGEFGIHLGARAAAVIGVSWVLGWVISFVRLSRK